MLLTFAVLSKSMAPLLFNKFVSGYSHLPFFLSRWFCYSLFSVLVVTHICRPFLVDGAVAVDLLLVVTHICRPFLVDGAVAVDLLLGVTHICHSL